LTLTDSQGSVLREIVYEAQPPWPPSADGSGFSLVLVDFRSDDSLPDSWDISSELHGSPGRSDETPAERISFAQWQSNSFTPEERANPEISGPNADPDGDQRSNFYEFAFGGEPKKRETAAAVSVDPIGETLSFQRPAGVANVDYQLQTSPDMKTWQDFPPAGVSVTRISADLEQVAWELPESFRKSGASFVRIRVQSQP
ncbi:MAG: hypothetical protein AAF514_07635, partial [Verrucomicrobiota bacterium]